MAQLNVTFRLTGKIVILTDELSSEKPQPEAVLEYLANEVGPMGLAELCEGLPDDGISVVEIQNN